MTWTMTELQVASPLDIIVAWKWGALLDSRERAVKAAQEEVKSFPIPAHVDDPIYHRSAFQGGREEDGGWKRAKDITNPVAMREIREALAKVGQCLPSHVSMAWAESLERGQWLSDVNGRALAASAKAQPMAKGVRDILDAVIADLEAMRFHLGDLPVEPPELPEEVDLRGLD